jgi:hypothetical protein
MQQQGMRQAVGVNQPAHSLHSALIPNNIAKSHRSQDFSTTPEQRRPSSRDHKVTNKIPLPQPPPNIFAPTPQLVSTTNHFKAAKSGLKMQFWRIIAVFSPKVGQKMQFWRIIVDFSPKAGPCSHGGVRFRAVILTRPSQNPTK